MSTNDTFSHTHNPSWTGSTRERVALTGIGIRDTSRANVTVALADWWNAQNQGRSCQLGGGSRFPNRRESENVRGEEEEEEESEFRVPRDNSEIPI